MYATKTGRILNDEELNQLDVLEIEQLGIRVAEHWGSWQEES